MVFSSLEFILLFLPVSIIGYYILLHFGWKRHALCFILLASFFYYTYWRVENILLIITSIGINYLLGKVLSSAIKHRKAIFVAGIIINLIMLLYFKYTIFILETISSLVETQISMPQIILPIGISFFTFQQIAYLSDIYTSKHDSTGEGLINYSLFVCFFPQLVAGPIVHHKEMMSQFANLRARVVSWENIYNGLILFSIGLSKKVLVADNLSPLVGYAFDLASSLTFSEALYASLCYTLQLYFDFSGYCDMAMGCALMLNIQLPWNFDSPYKAVNIQDFWRRWHMTLSRWLRDYLYIPLGGNRKGDGRTLMNLFLTFLLGGLWHGAAWTFVIWGVMHGIALVIHRLWLRTGRLMARPLAWLLTFAFINLAWVVFRAKDMDCLRRFTEAFAGFNGWAFREQFQAQIAEGIPFGDSLASYFVAIFLLLICFFGKNSREILAYSYMSVIYVYSVVVGILSIISMCIPSSAQEFIYFQF